MQRKNKTILFITLLIMILANISGCINNENYYENSITIQGKDQIYTIIMNAINDSKEGDTLLVSKGEYNETLTISKSISLIGESKDDTIIIGNKTGDVILITADQVNISGFTIKNSGDEYSYGVDAGIEINSNYNVISDNHIGSNDNYGIYITSGSKYNDITNNIISENRYGIYLNNGYVNNISSNNFSKNSDYGFYAGSQSNYNKINDNVFFENFCGIRIKSSENNKLTQNLFLKNQQGLYFCCGARNNIVYLNNFINNSVYNARDGNINQWDNGIYGNYWDDYNGKDINGDGIGNIHYEVYSTDKIDRYPLMELFQNYI